jgi:hypothetical protein
LSGTTRRTLDSMCHSGQVHFLKGWRMHKQGVLELDARWSQLVLRLVNTKPLEGYHGVTRSDGNDINKSIAEWLCTTNRRTLTLAVRTALAQRYGFNLPQPKNRKKIHEHRSLFMRPVPTILHDLIGIAATLDVGDLTTGGGQVATLPNWSVLDVQVLARCDGSRLSTWERQCCRHLHRLGSQISGSLGRRTKFQVQNSPACGERLCMAQSVCFTHCHVRREPCECHGTMWS